MQLSVILLFVWWEYKIHLFVLNFNFLLVKSSFLDQPVKIVHGPIHVTVSADVRYLFQRTSWSFWAKVQGGLMLLQNFRPSPARRSNQGWSRTAEGGRGNFRALTLLALVAAVSHPSQSVWAGSVTISVFRCLRFIWGSGKNAADCCRSVIWNLSDELNHR